MNKGQAVSITDLIYADLSKPLCSVLIHSTGIQCGVRPILIILCDWSDCVQTVFIKLKISTEPEKPG